MAEKSKILIIGGTGYIGKFIVEASAKSGHPTFVLLRESTVSDPAKGQIVDGFKNSGVTILTGDLYNHESLVKAIKQVDVVISTVEVLAVRIGNDVDRARAEEPIKSAFNIKIGIRRAIEAEGIPYTYVVSHYFAGYSLEAAVFNVEQDIGAYTIKAVDDPRTLNKVLYIKPPKNIYSFNELTALWEKKIGKTLEKEYIRKSKC
ncbi:UNVERIFIED_CONTAM: Isoflavone reductase-like protein [Sesamum radiatum]|uniref:Isoflavone reductase-like protein n=1 Tax=Sesamum radiatum TaxID=300843 RepID=A0AAW2PZB5_SESRA